MNATLCLLLHWFASLALISCSGSHRGEFQNANARQLKLVSLSQFIYIKHDTQADTHTGPLRCVKLTAPLGPLVQSFLKDCAMSGGQIIFHWSTLLFHSCNSYRSSEQLMSIGQRSFTHIYGIWDIWLDKRQSMGADVVYNFNKTCYLLLFCSLSKVWFFLCVYSPQVCAPQPPPPSLQSPQNHHPSSIRSEHIIIRHHNSLLIWQGGIFLLLPRIRNPMFSKSACRVHTPTTFYQHITAYSVIINNLLFFKGTVRTF